MSGLNSFGVTSVKIELRMRSLLSLTNNRGDGYNPRLLTAILQPHIDSGPRFKRTWQKIFQTERYLVPLVDRSMSTAGMVSG
jgi:hypothetical protein